MLLSALAAIGSIGSAIYGGIKASQAQKKANTMLGNFRTDRKRWYDAEQARDYTLRPDVQSVMNKQRELLAENYRRSRATNVVAGGTDASLALQRDATNKTMASVGSNIAAQGARYKDSIAAEGRNIDYGLQQQQIGIQQAKANSISNAAGQATRAMAGIAAGDTNNWADDLRIFGLGKKRKDDAQTMSV